ncbi:MAG: glycosyltransferase family 2 protein [Lachnospiraceae bacterium]
MKTSCVILNYNDAQTTMVQVRRICGYPSLDYVVVVDNCSTDDSWEKLQKLKEESEKEREKICLIRAEKNRGYGAGNNAGIRYSYEELETDFVLIANPDTVFTDTCVRNMTAVLCRCQDVSAVAPRMIDPVFGEQINGWKLSGFFGSLLKTGPICRRVFRRILDGYIDYPKQYFKGKKAVYVDAVHGSLLMVDAAKMLSCGGYDENVFLYNEEEILAYKLKQAGYRTVLILCQTYRHEHSVSISKSFKSAAKRQKIRNKSALYYYGHYLHIGLAKQAFARIFFQVILLEIWFCKAVLKMDW